MPRPVRGTAPGRRQDGTEEVAALEPPETGLLAIGEVARRSGVRASALRYYEQVGLVAPAARKGGRRHYDPAVLGRLAAVALLQEAGFTVAEIAELLGGQAPAGAPAALRDRWPAMAERKLRELDEHIERVTRARQLLEEALRCGCCDAGGCDLTRARTARPGARPAGPWTGPEPAPAHRCPSGRRAGGG